jgi:predicted MFS family arabinose efflux permease
LLEDFVLIVFLLYATRTLHFRPAALGLVFAAGGVGALLGSLTGGRAARVCGLGPALLASMTAACLAPLALLIRGHPGALTVAVLSVSFFVHGAGVAIGNVNVVTLRQVLTPDGLLGRMNASYRLLSYGAIPLGSLLGGVLGGLIGLRPALALGVLAMPSALLWVIFSPVPRLKALPDARRDPEADQTGAEAEQEASGFGGGEG